MSVPAAPARGGPSEAVRAAVRSRGWLALALLLALAPFHELLTSRVPVGRDLLFYFYPVKARLAEAVRAGELPLVDTLRWGGAPLLTAPGAAAFYPGNALFVVLPLPEAMKAWILLHLAIGVAGFHAFGRRLGLSPPFAALAGLAWGLSGAVVSLATFCGPHAALALLPWLAALAHDLARAPSTRTATKLGAAGGLLLLAPPPEYVAYAALLAGAVVLASREAAAREGSRPPGRRVASSLALSAALAAGIGAPALAAGLQAAQASPRGGGAGNEAWASVGSLPPARLVELLRDFLVADWSRVATAPGVDSYPYLPSIAPGMLVLVLGAAALLRPPRREALPPLLLVGAGLALALGPVSPLWRLLARTVPFFTTVRYPEKHLVLSALGFAWLFALGLRSVEARLREGRGRWVAAGSAFLLLLDRGPGARALMPTEPREVLTRPPALLAPLASARGESGPPPRLFHRDALQPVPAYDLTDLDAALRTGRETASPSYGSLFGLAYVFSPDYDLTLPLEAYEWTRLLSRPAPEGHPLPLQLVRNAGARAVVVSRPAPDGRFRPELVEVPDPVPPFRFAARRIADPDAARLFRRMLADGAPSDTGYLNAPSAPREAALCAGRVLSVRDLPSGLELDVEVAGPGDGLLLVSRLRVAVEAAALDGARVAVLDHAFGFAAVAVPAGRHRVSLRPDVTWVTSGLVTAAFALAAAGLLLRRERVAP